MAKIHFFVLILNFPYPESSSVLVVPFFMCILCMYVCMYVCLYVCMYVCMHACMYVCILSKGVIMLQDDARSHLARVCKDLMQHFRWEVLHPPPPLQPRPVALRFPCVRATKKKH